MTENKDKVFIAFQKEFLIQQPLTWGKVRDILCEKFNLIETSSKVILEVKENDENA